MRGIQSCYIITFFFVSYLFSGWLKAQHPVYYTLNDENGLPSNEVYQIVQDKFGYIWIGCDAGLYRYDGFEYKEYKAAGQNGRSISGLQLDSEDNLWCRNFAGQIYKLTNDSLHVAVDLKGTSTSSNSNFSLDTKGQCWFFRNTDVVCLASTGNEKVFSAENGNAGLNYFSSIICFNDEIYFLKNEAALLRLNPSSGKIDTLEILSNKAEVLKYSSFFVSKKKLFLLSHDPNKDKYIVSKLEQNQIKECAVYKKDEQNDRINGIVTDREEKTWICTVKGVFEFAQSSSKLSDQKAFFGSSKISNVFLDREGSYWFSTLDKGIFICPNLSVIRYESSNISLPENNITGLLVRNNKEIFLGSHTGKISKLNVEENKLIQIPTSSDIKTISTKKIIEGSNAVFFSHGQVGELKNNKIEPYTLYNARDMVVVGDSMYYVMPEFVGSIALKDLRAKKKNALVKLNNIGGRAIRYNQQTKKFYLALNEGTFIYDQGKWIKIEINGKPVFTSDICMMGDTVWMATISSGVVALKDDKVVISYNAENGMQDNEFKNIFALNGLIWVSNNKAIYSISPKIGKITMVTSKSGVNPQDVNTMSGYEGNLVLATNKGLVILPTDIQWQNNMAPSIKIVETYFDGKILFPDSLISLPYNNKNYEILLSSVSLRSRGKYQYAYRLLGLDSAWINVDASANRVVYSSLPSGDFVFEVKAINESGISSEIKKMSIHVDSPVWQKWWFFLSASLVVVFGVLIIAVYRIRFLKHKANSQNQLISSQLAAINAQMNPHFMYNTLNSIQDLILKSDIKSTNYYLSRFSSLMRKILDASQYPTIVLEDEMEILELYLSLEKLRFGDEFTYSIQCDEIMDAGRIAIPSIIIQPFVENAIKHGLLHKKGQRNLMVNFKKVNDNLVCVVEDNGVGRKRSAEIKERSSIGHKSFATKATEKRIELINSTGRVPISLFITDLEENGQPCGTRVEINIPFSVS